MGILVLLLGLIPLITHSYCMEHTGNVEPDVNVTDSNKEMYVIHAMIYQVGIITNQTDNETSNMNATGNQETLTFYHNNGSQIDLSGIPQPLLTNVTAQSIVGVAPVSNVSSGGSVPWSALQQLTRGSPSDSEIDTEKPTLPKKLPRHVHNETNAMDDEIGSPGVSYKNIFKRSTTQVTPVKISKGSAVIPEAAGVNSIAIPPLLTLNNNFSEIPVPIPNTSVVHYAKINTLISKP